MTPDKIFLTVNGKRMSLEKLIENPKAATDVWVDNCAGLTALPELPAATVVRVLNCAGLTALPELPAATVVWVLNCAGLTAGKDSRGYSFYGAKIRGSWRVMAGCRNLSIAEALKHWGPGGSSDRADCLGFVKIIAAFAKAHP